VSLATGSAADAFVPSEEEQRIRETVASIAGRYGRAYMRLRRCAEEERPRWGVRTAKIAPVPREMILNYVAGHSLRLPRSY
jgi:hypothetical protein